MTERVFRKNLTIGVLEDMDVRLDKIDELKERIKEPKTLRIFLNAMIESGEPFTRDTPIEDLLDAVSQLPDFLASSTDSIEERQKAMKAKLQEQRKPK